jgi:hypothetical protein
MLVGLSWYLLKRNGQSITLMVPLLAVPLFLAALSISLGNWMDRRTILRLDEAGVEFSNGLRHVRLGWEQIRRVSVLESPWGRKVQVLGDAAFFEFRTLGEVKVQGQLKGRVGFAQGEHILGSLIEKAGLHPSGGPAGNEVYVRE